MSLDVSGLEVAAAEAFSRFASMLPFSQPMKVVEISTTEGMMRPRQGVFSPRRSLYPARLGPQVAGGVSFGGGQFRYDRKIPSLRFGVRSEVQGPRSEGVPSGSREPRYREHYELSFSTIARIP